MDHIFHILLTVPRFSIGARFLCMQKVIELERNADIIRTTKGVTFLESEFHYSDKLHYLSLISNYLLDSTSVVTEAEFVDLISRIEDEW